MNRSRRAGRARSGCAALTLLLAPVVSVVSMSDPASGHVTSTTGYAQLAQIAGDDVSMTLLLDIEMLLGDVGLGGGTSHSPRDLAGAARALAADEPALSRRVEAGVRVYEDGVSCPVRLDGTGVEENAGTVYGQLDLRFVCPDSFDGPYHLEYDLFTAPDAKAQQDALIVGYQLAGESGRTVLDREVSTMSVGDGSPLVTAGRFLVVGGKHILFGWDHLLFVLALLLGARQVRDLVKVASLFTVAHSVTLITTSVGMVGIPAVVVEPLIALSITYVAVENLFGREMTRRRMLAVFAFGLLHGMGFAGSLRMDDEMSWRLLGALLSFNVGIELGQLLFLALAFPLVWTLRRYRWTAPTITAGTVAVATAGAFWFMQRLGLV